MSSAVTVQKKDSIIAFFNIFSDKLRLERCKVIFDVEYLMHTAVKFIQSGSLQYYDHSEFGFTHTVDFLRLQLQPCYYNALDPKAAAQEDEVECVKISVALLYVFRLLQTAKFEDWVNSLPLESNSQIAGMVGYLDFPDMWNSPDSWPEILWKSDIDAGGDASSSIADSPSFAASASVAFCDSTTFFDGMLTPVANKMRMYKSSPISAVLKSPTGSNALKMNQMRRSGGQARASQIIKINHLQKCLIEQKEQLKITGAELDVFQTKCQKLEEENAALLDKNERLEKKMAECRATSKELEILQQQIGETVQREAALLLLNDSLLAERDSSIGLRRQLSVEREDVLKQLDLAKEELAVLHHSLSKVGLDFRNEMESHCSTRLMFSKLSDEHTRSEAKWLQKRLQHRLDEKEKVVGDQVQHIQASEEQHNRLKKDIEVKMTEISSLQNQVKALKEVAAKQKKPSRASASIANTPQLVKQVPRFTNTRPRATEWQPVARSQVKAEPSPFFPLSSDTTPILTQEASKKVTKIGKQTEQERLHQLKERNRKQPRHLQENYMPEINGMSKGACVIDETKSKSPFRHFNCFNSGRKR
uniref:Uncharacterized protein n=1 Tax=Ditylenchus dipsaci TaxID=166011 RepID=A0A915CLX9_9BILA